MTVFKYDLVHKNQTKANDCWYASIQMLKSWKAGKKSKATGTHTSYLHSGVLGHKLHAEAAKSKHFSHVLKENGMKTIGRNEFGLHLMEPNPAFPNGANTLSCLQKYGPIIIGGTYGAFGPFKNLGHFIVLSGIDTDSRKFKINDPDKRVADWRSQEWVIKHWWDDDESAIVLA